MSYTAVPTVSNDDDISASWWNTYVRNNFESGIPAIFSDKGDIAVASAANAATTLAAGTNTQCIEADSGEGAGIKNSWNFVPVGGIIMWGGDLGDLPSNWQLCNGTNGTPDLRNRFVIGAGNNYSVGNTGGAESINLAHDHESSGTAGTSSTVGGSHSHTLSGNTGAGSSHRHQDETSTYAPDDTSYDLDLGYPYINTPESHYHYVYTDYESSHVHSVPTPASASDSHDHTIGFDGNELSSTQDIRPQYYALAFIMRLS